MKRLSIFIASVLLLWITYVNASWSVKDIKCSYNINTMTIGCESNISWLEIKNIVQMSWGQQWNIYYNDTLIYKNAKLFYYCWWDMCPLSFFINTKNKTFLFDYTTEGDICWSKKSTEKIGFDWTSKYKLQYEWDLNPTITFHNSKYITSIFFSGKSKKFIKSPTNKTSYNWLYMETKNIKTWKITTKTLYSFSPLSYTDFCWWDNNTFHLKYLGVSNDILSLSTNTRKITIDISNLKTKAQRIKNL